MTEIDAYEMAIGLVTEMQKASISILQRYLRIGYCSASRIMDKMAENGIVSEPEPSTTLRKVLRKKAV